MGRGTREPSCRLDDVNKVYIIPEGWMKSEVYR